MLRQVHQQRSKAEFKYILNKVDAIVQPCLRALVAGNSSNSLVPIFIVVVTLVYSASTALT